MTLRSLFLLVVLTIMPMPVLLAAPRVEGAYVLPDRPVWAGEVFELGMQWRVDRAAFRALSGELNWSVEPLAADAWTQPMLNDGVASSMSVIRFNRSVMAPRAGRITLSPASLGFLMQTGSISNGDYTRAILEPIQAQSQSATLMVRALPAAPAGFRGAVGQFRLESSVDREQIESGGLVTWTLSLSGRGNWPMLAALPTRTLPAGLLIRDTVRDDIKVSGEFERTRREILTFVVVEPGTYRLPSMRLPIFDPVSGRYVTLESPPVQFVAPGAAVGASEFESELLDNSIDVIQPLSGSLRAIAPLALNRFDRSLILSLLLIGLLWMSLASWRAWQLDPERVLRAAHRQLRRATHRLAAIDLSRPLAESTRSDLYRWQLALAECSRVVGSAPTSADFVGREPWYALWVQADAALYGPISELPADWSERAARALTAMSVPPPFDWRLLWQAQCWWPRVLSAVVIVCAFLFVPVHELRAETALERASQQVELDPLDVVARYNLSIALEAEGRLSEAAVHSGIAWVQEPRFVQGAALWSRLRSQSGLLSAEQGGLPESVGVAARLRAGLPPGFWQRLQLAVTILLIASTMLLLISGYWRRLRPLLRVTVAIALVSLVGVLATLSVTSSYGRLLEEAAVVVHQQSILREIPVENRLDEGAWVLPGAAGVIERRFLNWVLLSLADGRTGWVREETVIAVWGAK
ncbi:MAG: hypothetical protein ACO3P5_09470 [Steroidobacteraceae bacterium]